MALKAMNAKRAVHRIMGRPIEGSYFLIKTAGLIKIISKNTAQRIVFLIIKLSNFCYH